MRVHATRSIAADPDMVFALITSIERLPEWNRAISRTIEVPAQLTPGTQWVVEVGALGQSWPSRSTVLELDGRARTFRYRAQTDDGNPSYADWTWRVTGTADGCDVTASADVHPRTFWRRVLLAPIRARQLRTRELPASLAALATAVARSAPKLDPSP